MTHVAGSVGAGSLLWLGDLAMALWGQALETSAGPVPVGTRWQEGDVPLSIVPDDEVRDPVLDLVARSVQDRSPKGIAAAVHRLIRAGKLQTGDRLPTVRDLAKELGVSPATVSAETSCGAVRGTSAA